MNNDARVLLLLLLSISAALSLECSRSSTPLLAVAHCGALGGIGARVGVLRASLGAALALNLTLVYPPGQFLYILSDVRTALSRGA